VSFITADEFERISELIYRKTGMRFESKKLYYLSKRAEKRVEALGLASVSQHVRMLYHADPKGEEFQKLINIVTINETYFFRDFPQLQAFAEQCLSELCGRKASRGDGRLRIWSAGCSTGEEPYTLGIILQEMVENVRNWDIRITASDIDVIALEKAKEAVYAARSIRDVPPEYLARYFRQQSDGNYKLSKNIRQMVNFEHLNLADKTEVRKRSGYDVIFCRNMLIYFDDLSRKNLVDHFYVALNPGGYIFLGSSESLGRINSAFKIKRVEGFLVYYKE